jgi:hypothetical protein
MLAGVPAGDNFEGTIEDPELLMEVRGDAVYHATATATSATHAPPHNHHTHPRHTQPTHTTNKHAPFD